MQLDRTQRRALIAMCCEVAKADGSVNTSEYEALLDLLGRLAQGAVGFSELTRWMEQGPPRPEARLPDEAVRLFLREAVTIARADGKVEEVEIATMKQLVERYFEISQVA